MNEDADESAQTSADKSHVFLAVFDFGNDASFVTSLLGFSPTSVWLVGEPLPNHPAARRRHCRWTFKSPLPLQAPVEEHISKLLSFLEPFSPGIRECAARFPAMLGCAIYYRDFTPGIHLSKSVLHRIAALDLSLDLDLYFLGDPTNSDEPGTAEPSAPLNSDGRRKLPPL